ncbi:MAG: hypothetical protein MJZ07_09430 [Bacteroidales bacterium]|nr:hypothetical protein [Bacteroidales bacterium]
MKKSIRLISALFLTAAAATLSACKQDIIFTDVPEGEPTRLTLEVNVPVPEEVIMTKATDLQETHISKIALLFYKSASSRPIVIEQQSQTLKQKISETNYIYTVTCDDEEVTSGSWYLYAIANYDATDYGTVKLSEVKQMTKNQIDSYIINQASPHLDMIDDGLLLTGRYGDTGEITLKGGENDFTGSENRIHLRRMAAKIKIKVEAVGGVKFAPESITIHNYSQSATLFERRGWTNASGEPDYKGGTFPGTMGYSGSSSFTDIKTNFATDGSITFYMMENAQVAKNEFPSDNYNYREATSANCVSTLTDSFYYSPDKGTYVTITGEYQGPGAKEVSEGVWEVDNENTVSGDVTYTMHLGNFSTTANTTDAKIGRQDNFTIRRNTKYNYKIRVAGVKNIIVEANTDEENNTGANGNLIGNKAGTTNITLDSHYETVQLVIPAQKYDSYIIQSKTPYDKNVMYKVVNGSGAEGSLPEDISWIKFLKSPSTTAVAEYPVNGEGLFGVQELMAALGDEITGDSDKYLLNDGKLYVTAFVNEYFYEGKQLTDFVNKDSRELKVIVGIAQSADKLSSYIDQSLFSIKQRAIVSGYDLSVDNPLGLESLEEINSSTDNGRVQFNAGNADNTLGTSASYGWNNTQKLIGGKSANWSDYFTMSSLAHFNNKTEITVSGEGQYAAYQCLSRNRDENGNGVIDDAELKWYLPSHDECLAIWNGWPALSDLARPNTTKLYYSSTNGASGTWWVDEGSAFGKTQNQTKVYWGTTYGWKKNVRCVRALKTYNQEPTATSSFNSSNNTIHLSGLGEGSIRDNGKTGEYVPHHRNDGADQLPTSFVVAAQDLTFDSGTINTITPARVASAGYDDANKLNIKLANYTALTGTGYTIYYQINNGAPTAANEETIKGIDPANIAWANNSDGSQSATVTIYSSKNISGEVYASNESTVVFTRTATDSSDAFNYSAFTEWGSAVAYGQNAYPIVNKYVNHNRDARSIAFQIDNLSGMSAFSYQTGIEKGSNVKNSQEYPRVNSADLQSPTRLYVVLAASSNQISSETDYFYYRVGNKDEQAIYRYHNNFTATIEDDDWVDDAVTVTIYSKYEGYSGTAFQTTITITRTTSHPYYSVQQSNGTFSEPIEITAQSTTVTYSDDQFADDMVKIKIFAQEFDSPAYTSYVVVSRYNSDFKYDGDYTNGRSKIVETNIVSHGPANFTLDDVANQSYCEMYYSEMADKSDLGKWRIPNERELGIIYIYINLSNSTASRSLYLRDSGKSYPYYISDSHITTDPKEDGYRIRCVRDGN